MSCVLEILTDEELLSRKEKLEKQIKKIDNELRNRSLFVHSFICDTINNTCQYTNYDANMVSIVPDTNIDSIILPIPLNININNEESIKKIIKIKIKKKS